MTDKSLVSIITPFLNAENFLEEAINSVLNQTYPYWELLLIDDGATDQSTEIAKRHARRYPEKIKYLAHRNRENRGKSVSRNLGLSAARGRFIAFLDADDVFLSAKLDQQVKLLHAQARAVMVYGPTCYWHSWTGKHKDLRKDHIQSLGVVPNRLFEPPQLMVHFLRYPGNVPCTCALLVRSEAIAAVQGFEESIQNMYEDQVFLAKICLHGPTYVSGDCLDKYRQHEDSSSHVAIRSGEYHPYLPNPARLAFLQWLGGHMQDRGIEDAELANAYRFAQRPYRYPRLYRFISPIQYLARRVHRRLAGPVQRFFQPQVSRFNPRF